jgi:hypothetical protein
MRMMDSSNMGIIRRIIPQIIIGTKVEWIEE